MSANTITSGYAERLCSLAESQLLMQTARSAALDTVAIGVMALDAAFVAIVLTAGHTDVRIFALCLLGLSLTFAAGVLALPSTQCTGPSISRMRATRTAMDDDDPRFTERLLDGFEHDIHTNEQTVSRKATLFNAALTFVSLTIVMELIARL
jgi:hypothetical protein